MSDNKIGNTSSADDSQDVCDTVIPVMVPAALKLRVIERVGKGKVSPYVRALIERDLAA